MKYCPCCKTTIPVEEFYTSKGKPHSYCKVCWRQKVKDKYKKPDKTKTKVYTLKSRFGLSIEDYHLLYTEQKGLCAICGKPISMFAETRDLSSVACVDHNHTTGVVRGLLCNHCNTGIGLLKENPEILRNAVQYLIERGSK